MKENHLFLCDQNKEPVVAGKFVDGVGYRFHCDKSFIGRYICITTNDFEEEMYIPLPIRSLVAGDIYDFSELRIDSNDGKIETFNFSNNHEIHHVIEKLESYNNIKKKKQYEQIPEPVGQISSSDTQSSIRFGSSYKKHSGKYEELEYKPTNSEIPNRK